MSRIRRVLPIIVVSGLAMASGAWGQSGTASSPSGATAGAPGATFRSTGDPRRDTLLRMTNKRLSLEVTEARLEDVLTFIKDTTQADLEFIWQGDSDAAGLDKERKVTLNIKNRSALSILETVLDKTRSDLGSAGTWQMTPHGAMQVGPKEALNRERRVETYDINDLLTVIPTYADVPEIDLNSVLQQSQGGGGGQSPFRDQGGNNNEPRLTRDERAKQIIDILIANVEPEQWSDNGGDAATIRHYNGTLLVNAPDYVHRQVAGYPYWPSYTTRTASNGRRYLTLNADTGASKIDGFGREDVSAIVGGRPVSSGGGGGGLRRPAGGGEGGGGR